MVDSYQKIKKNSKKLTTKISTWLRLKFMLKTKIGNYYIDTCKYY